MVRYKAEQGDAAAQFVLAQVDLGNVYSLGQGVPQDFAQAATWFRRAAEQADGGAQYALAEMYAKGARIS